MTKITPVAGHNGWFEVCTGGGTYAVNSDDGVCTCKHFEHRLSHLRGALCRHGSALAAYLDKQRDCPVCDGRGCLTLNGVYVGPDGIPDRRPQPCAACEGSGIRADHD